uniref:Uncharacterized protein n=1 Tax=Rhinolophus ferrumequinum TaxID=59479 RepID=A0A671FSZ2_RHIFE
MNTVGAVGLTIAAAGFAGHYVLQAMKHVEPQVKQVFQSLPKSAFSSGKVNMTVCGWETDKLVINYHVMNMME